MSKAFVLLSLLAMATTTLVAADMATTTLVAAEKKVAAAGVAFKSQDDIVDDGNGLQHRVLVSGPKENVRSPMVNDVVKAHYKGILAAANDAGEEVKFDASYDRGQPLEFGLQSVIAGWTKILQKMKVGDKWEVYIPSSLGYGARGAGSVIPPNADLIFIVELVEIVTIAHEL